MIGRIEDVSQLFKEHFKSVREEYQVVVKGISRPCRVVSDTDLAGYPANNFAGYPAWPDTGYPAK